MFDLHENEPVGTNFHRNGFAQRLVLIQRLVQKGNSTLTFWGPKTDLFGLQCEVIETKALTAMTLKK